ncbi:sensor histidine kinase [Luteimonas aestuarii]|uniref:Sensor histidine kinase n=1 Tax=Luteimonas aestuarii TaxID=453837 RepID=A0A4R5U1M4_9GAMM|nr:histidine kinase [Luteimonas aestuarii]TDK27520.1 sensor histidine kinase [Luteimonas aestuarii]
MTDRASAPPPLRPLDTLWEARMVFRIVLAGEAVALLLALAPGVEGDRLAYFGIASFAAQWVSLMTLGMLFLLRRCLVTLGPIAIAQVALAALLASTWCVSGLAWLLLHDLWPAPAGGWMRLTLQMTGIAAIVGLLALAAFQNHWSVRQLAVHAKQSQLEALQARIRPHFLFNTINTGIALVRSRPDQAERLLLDLSDLFRAALAGPAAVTLAEELSLARRYLEIESLRFGNRLAVHWEVPPQTDGLLQVRLPSLSIQPLVENAIKHGIEPHVGGGAITVSAHAEANATVVTVRNSLHAGDPAGSAGHQIGLSAVKARIEAFTGGAGSVDTQASDHEFIATLRLPVA